MGLFNSFFLGGFECSTHRLPSGKRLDLIHSTRHDTLAERDYRLLQRHGIHTARDGLRWHLIEERAGRRDFTTARVLLQAARKTQTQVIWDLWHYGWPDHLDIFSADFVSAFTRYAREAAQVISEYCDPPMVSPINEISFFCWAGGEAGIFNPFAQHRGDEMKRQLIRASIEGISAMRDVNPAIRLFQIDPMINVLPRPGHPEDAEMAEAYRQSQFQAWDMLSGQQEPGLGGKPEFLDVIGVNYYIHNQWTFPGGHGSLIVPSDPRYRHVSTMLQEIYQRYRRPLFIAETGIEDDTRPAWLRYISHEVFAAQAAGVPVEGICLYPIVNHPGWDDDRHCYNGLFDYADKAGHREVYEPLADELRHQQELHAALSTGRIRFSEVPPLESSRLDWAAHAMEDRTEESRSSVAQ